MSVEPMKRPMANHLLKSPPMFIPVFSKDSQFVKANSFHHVDICGKWIWVHD